MGADPKDGCADPKDCCACPKDCCDWKLVDLF